MPKAPGSSKKGSIAHYLEAQRIAFAPLMFQAARVARDNGLLQAVEDAGPEGLTPEEAAEKAGSSRYGARVLLEGCLALQLVLLRGGRYVIERAGRLVLHDEMTRVNMDFVHDVCYRGAFFLEQSIAEGRPVGLGVFGDWPTIYEGLSKLPPQVQKSWFAFDHFYSDAAFPQLLPGLFGGKPARILDVGGNTGKWALACTKFDPAVRVTILDHPGQLEQAKANATAAGVGDRVDGHAMDLLDHSRPFPKGFDLVWMSQFLDCFPEADIVQLLRRGREALAPGGKLCVLETYWDKQPNEVAQFCINATSLYFTCMANGTSRMYHSEDMRQCVAEAGLEVDDESQFTYHTLFSCRARS